MTESHLELRLECEQFLYREAECLDDGRLHEWLDLLADDVDYRIPRRVTRERGAEKSEFSDDSYLYREDRGTLETRVKRFDKEYAWAENPPSRLRHFVTNVRVASVDGDEIDVRSNVLLYRNQGETTEEDVISCERRDTLRRTDDGLELATRTVFLDQTVLGTRNLSFFV
ncbi:MAG: 3-phenylpropionate/cinnamic acid dioxygenase subunit beta [Haloarculaceae archaeon]